jgi:hypothetical protein
MSKRPNSDEKLTSLNKKRNQVKEEMTAAWDKPSPDLAALEVLHYELKNLEYTIATLRAGKRSLRSAVD